MTAAVHALKIELGGEIQQLVKQISNLSSKLFAELKALKTRAKSTEDSVTTLYNNWVRSKIKFAFLRNH